MTITVSISQFRQNISKYIEQAQAGHIIVLRDKKKDETVAELTGKKKFDPIAFGKALKAAAGTFTAKNHPEWRTKKDVIRWVAKERKAADRTF